MNFPNLRPLCCMPKPKMMRTSWTLKGMLKYILANGLLQKKNNNNNDNEMKKEEPKGDEYIISLCLRQKVENQ